MSRTFKVHSIAESGAGRSRTRCGKEGFLCPGFEPTLGHPGEYETAIDERFEATPFAADVTCGRCKAIDGRVAARDMTEQPARLDSMPASDGSGCLDSPPDPSRPSEEPRS